MNALTFLYWSLGIGFCLLVLFIIVALIYLIKILKDVSKTTGYVTEAVEKVNENVGRITDKITDVTEQLADYVVKPLTVIQFVMEKLKPMMDIIQKKSEEWGGLIEQEGEEAQEKPKKKGHFGRKK